MRSVASPRLKVSGYVSIIYLPITSAQFFLGVAADLLYCPLDDTRLAKNGSYGRHILDRHPLRVIRIQRYRCAACHVTYSALPYDLRPYTAAIWTLTWTIWMWHVEAHQPWSTIQDWLRRHEMILDWRTLQRWQTRWRQGLPRILLDAHSIHRAAVGHSGTGTLGSPPATVSRRPMATVAAASGCGNGPPATPGCPAGGIARNQRITRMAPTHILCRGRLETALW